MRLLWINALLFTSCIISVNAQTASLQESSPSALPPGITLPKTGSVYAIDPKASDQPLVQLHATEVVSNSHAGGNFARSQVFMNLHATTELPGLSSSVSVSNPQTSFLVRLNTDDAELTRKRVQLIHLAQTKERRVVSDYSQNVFGGSRQRHYDIIPTTKTDVEPDVWLRMTPLQPLPAGEYSIVFVPKDANASVESAYDFKVGQGTTTAAK